MKRILKKLRPKSKTKNQDEGVFYENLKNILKFSPKDISFYEEAFTHSSMRLKGPSGSSLNYERLEFLGDAVLGSIVASFLFHEFPDENEGFLTQMRSKIVSREHLNKLGKGLQLIELVKSNVSRSKIGNNINGNLFEALIGAVYLDKGYMFCERFVNNTIIAEFVDLPRLEGKISSYKSLIVEWTQKNKQQLKYDVFEDSGNQNQRHFSVRLLIDDQVISKGRSTSKKKAEEIASKRAYFVLQDRIR